MKPHLSNYVAGFAISVLLTLIAPLLLWAHANSHHTFLSHGVLTSIFVILALLQLVVQLVFFLHVGKDKKPHWNSAALALALIIVGILVGGTLWIMNNLSYTHQMPQEFMNDMPSPANQLE
jgi:cytochrome o ubiquinol oxidase operon protein cyoD